MRLSPPLDDRTSWSALGRCPIEKAIALVGSRNAMLILREAFYGSSRFEEFAERVGMAPATAASNLRALADAGLLERRPYRNPGDRQRDEYLLTAAGAELLPVVVALYEWGQRHTDAPPFLELTHADCGESVAVQVSCGAGHELVSEQVEVRRVRS